MPEEVARMNRIIEDLLDYSREKPMQRKRENLQELVQSVLGLLPNESKANGYGSQSSLASLWTCSSTATASSRC